MFWACLAAGGVEKLKGFACVRSVVGARGRMTFRGSSFKYLTLIKYVQGCILTTCVLPSGATLESVLNDDCSWIVASETVLNRTTLPRFTMLGWLQGRKCSRLLRFTRHSHWPLIRLDEV